MDFQEFVEPLKGLTVSHAWRGHLSMFFLEVGPTKPGKVRRDGSVGNPIGEFTIDIEPNWRFEGRRSILCGSDDSIASIDRFVRGLVGSTVKDLSSFGHLPELELVLSSGRLLTFSAWKGQPNWSINHWRRDAAMYSKFGKIKFD